MARLRIIGINYAPESTGNAPYTTGLAEHLVNECCLAVVHVRDDSDVPDLSHCLRLYAFYAKVPRS